MNNMMKILSRVVLIAAFGILFSFMSKTEVKADDLEFVSASIDAPSEVVKGQNYTISATFTFNRVLTVNDYSYVSEKCSVEASPDYKSSNPIDSASNDTFILRLPITIPSNASGDFTIRAKFDGDVKTSSIIPIVDSEPTTHTVTFNLNGGNINGDTSNVTRTTGTDGKLTAFPEVQRNEFTFDGWFDEATSMTTRVGLDKVYSGATTLTAHWTETPSNPVCTGASINAPSQLVKGQSYNIPFIFTFNRDLTDADHQFISDNAVVSYSVNYKSGTSEDTYRNNTYTWMYPISIPLDATGSLTLQILFEGEDQDTKTIPIVDPSPTPPSSTEYNVTVTTDGHGEAYANKRSGVSGTKVMLKEVPDDGYKFKQWEVVSGGVELDNYRDYTTSFTIKSADVEIKAHFDKDDDSHEESRTSVAEPSWTPAKAAATIAAEKAEKQQAARTQIAAVQTLLTTLVTTNPTDGVINLDMTKVDILNPPTVNLLVLKNKFEYNIKISVAGGLTTTVKIPANFNFRQFIKEDGTMNIHEVLWSIILSRK